MRVHSRWFRASAARSPEAIAGAMAVIAWRVAHAMLVRMRKAGFTLEAGPRYFEFLSEALAFAIQLAWREACRRMDEASREAFAQAFAVRVASVFADNEADLLGAEVQADIESRFVARVNRRFEEYADFDYGPEGPGFAFLRYFASLAAGIVAEPDRRWVHDQVIAVEGPEAAATLSSAIASLLDEARAAPREARAAAASPFASHEGDAWRRWAERKLAARPRSAADLVVEVRDPRHLTAIEHAAIVARCRRANMAIYASRTGGDDASLVQGLAARLGLRTPEDNPFAGAGGVARITVDARKAADGFIPYTSRRMLWHTDGYYNPPGRPVRAMLLHCVRDAASGGETALLDPELAWIMLREAGREFVQALEAPDALTIPPRSDRDGEARPASVGPVFSVVAGSGDLHMRYTARRRSVQWHRDATTAAAAARLLALMDRDTQCVLRTRLEPGMGLVCNNVLHQRSAFEDAPGEDARLLLRVRYRERIAGTEGAWTNP